MENLQKARFFAASLQDLPSITNWINGRLENTSFSEKEKRQIELALEEALVNIIRYAFSEKGGEIELECRYFPREKIEFKILDQGQMFNPLLQKDPDKDLPLEERKVGGLGILFMRKSMDDIFYERKDSYNILILVKKCRS